MARRFYWPVSTMTSTTDDNARPQRGDYHWFCLIPTRWMDNDTYGYVNNVTYYSYFDAAANRFLIERRSGYPGLADHRPGGGFTLPLQLPVTFPDQVQAGLHADRLGNRSVTYGIAIFSESTNVASAHGYFVHVFVDRNTNQSAAIPATMRQALQTITA